MIVFCVVFVALVVMYIKNVYLMEFLEVSEVYKSLKMLLDSRDVLVLKILPDVNNEKLQEKILNLIDDRSKKFRISYDDGIFADAELNNELKKFYEVVNEMKKNELQEEVFRKLIHFENQIKSVRKKYSLAVQKYNMSLTIHPKFCVKFLRLRPFELYKNKD